MRQMSFSLTTAQMRDRSKTVTRRLGWAKLQPGTTLMAIERGMGLKKGERVVPIHPIRVLDVRREPLDALLGWVYGPAELVLEGFPGMDPCAFLALPSFARLSPSTLVTRIHFEHLP